MERNIYLCKANAEETIHEAIELVKEKAELDSRRIAFDDCTNFWRREVEEVLKSDSPNGAKLNKIRELLNIKPVDSD